MSKHNDIQFQAERSKIQPQSIELEAAVLGAILMEKQAFSQVESILDDSDFYSDSHQEIYRIVKKLTSNNKPIDLLTVSEELHRQGKLEGIGGGLYLGELVDRIVSSAHLEYHAQIVKQKSIERQLISLNGIASERVFQGENVGDVLFQTGKEIDKLQENLIGKKVSSHISVALAKAMKAMHERTSLASNNQLSGIDTGLSELNERTNGWQNGDLIILASRPAIGKTALALFFAKSAAKQTPVAVFSLEMSDISLANRLLLSETSVSPDRFRAGNLTKEEIHYLEQATGRIWKMPIYVDDNPSVSMDYIRMKSRILKKQGKCGLIIVDYLQLASGDKKKEGNREQEVAQMSRTAKITAKELNVPFILLSQVNRGSEQRKDKQPHLSDLRESGAIEQDSDLVCLIHRPEVYGIEVYDQQENKEENYGELHIAKFRNGKTGLIKFKHNGSMTHLFDYEPQTKPSPAF